MWEFKLEELNNVFINELKKSKGNSFKINRLEEYSRIYYLSLENEYKRGINLHNKRYENGAIVFVNLGVNIGTEFSAPHFCVVLNKKDRSNSEKLTVMPLSSKNFKGRVKIDDDLYLKVLKSLKSEVLSLGDELDDVEKLTKIVSENSEMVLKERLSSLHNFEIHKQMFMDALQIIDKTETNDKYIIENQKDLIGTSIFIRSQLLKKKEEIARKIEMLKECIAHYTKYEKDSYGLIDNITTVSKSRIIKPINKFDPIGKMKVTDQDMVMIKSVFNDRFI